MRLNDSKIRTTIPAVFLIVVLFVLPIAGMPQNWLLFLFVFFTYVSMANMWNLLAGYSGLISLCQPAFIGVAAYTVTLLAWIGVPLYLGMVAAAIVSAAFAMIISIPVFRMKGIYFAIGTLIVPEVMRLIFLIWRPVGGSIVGGGAGYAIKKATEIPITYSYWLALFIWIASVVIMRLILNSLLGLGLAAIRDNDNSAASSGVNVFKLKLYSFVISGVVTGLAGAAFYIFQGYVDPENTFSIRWTIAIMLSTILGGINTEEGPIVGAAIVVFIYFMLAKYAGVSLLIQGIILTGIMLLAPHGIVGALRQTRPYQTLLRLATGGSVELGFHK